MNSGHKLWLANTAEQFHGSRSELAEIKLFYLCLFSVFVNCADS